MRDKLKPSFLVLVLAVLGLFLIVSPLFLTNESEETGVDTVSQSGNIVTPEETDLPEPTPSATPEEQKTSIITLDDPSPTDPLVLLSQGLVLYQNTLKEEEGAQGSLVTANGNNVKMSFAPNGDYRAETGNPSAPEWLLVEGKVYARLGEKEIEKQKTGFEKIGKPNVQWTDAAVGTEKQIELFSAGNLSNVIADISPLLEDITVQEGENGSKVIEAQLPLDKAGKIANTYNLTRTPSEMLEPELMYAKVIFTIDTSGMLTGYIVEPPKGKQPVSFVLFPEFQKIEVNEPEADIVITLEDLARAADLALTENAATPTPSPEVSESPSPEETEENNENTEE